MKRPAFQFYPGDFLSDENVALMTNQELGCYIKLLCFCWIHGSIPSDIEKIAVLCSESSTAINSIWNSIRNCFELAQNSSNRLVNPRLELELKKQIEFQKKKQEAGRIGGISKSINNLRVPNVVPSTATLLLENNPSKTLAKASSSSSISSSITNIKEKKKINKRKQEKGSERFLEFWESYPRKEAKTKAWDTWSKNDLEEIADEIIQDVILRRDQHVRWEEKKFIPLPVTYLNQERWKDEIVRKTDEHYQKRNKQDNFDDFVSRQRQALAESYLREQSDQQQNDERSFDCEMDT